MSHAVSPSTGRVYGLQRLCLQWQVNRSTITSQQAREKVPEQLRPAPCRPGPKGPCSDEELARGIQWEIAASPWHGEGYRKIWARLRYSGIRCGRDRIRRVMRETGQLSPHRTPDMIARHPHNGTITTELPDVMWGTDATETITLKEGRCAVFIGIDHCTGEITGIHAAKRATRWEALEPIRQGIRERFGGFIPGIATGLEIRHDHGSQYMSDDFQNEIAWFGCISSPSFVRQPEGNGIAERFMRTLKENLLWIQHFDTIEELRLALHKFKDTYNNEWILERHGYKTPAHIRATLTPQQTLETAA